MELRGCTRKINSEEENFVFVVDGCSSYFAVNWPAMKKEEGGFLPYVTTGEGRGEGEEDLLAVAA